MAVTTHAVEHLLIAHHSLPLNANLVNPQEIFKIHFSAYYCSGGSCVPGNKPTSASCDDGNLCTINDHCNGAGLCIGTAIDCSSHPIGQCETGCYNEFL